MNLRWLPSVWTATRVAQKTESHATNIGCSPVVSGV
jgi:hypothetical protein